MKKLILVLLGIALCSPAWATVTTSQKKCTGTTTTDGCGSVTACTLSGLTAVGAGHLLVALLLNDTGNSTASISSLTTETWTHCTGCTKSTAQGTADASYALSAAGGQTSIQMTLSAAPGVGWNFCIYEYSTTTSGFSFDNACISAIASAAPTTCAVASLTGTNDVKVGAIVWAGSLTGVSAPGADFIEANGNGTADVLNVATTTGIAFTPTTANSGADFMVAFKEAAAGGGTTCRPSMSTMGVSACG